MPILVRGISWNGPASDGGSPALRLQPPPAHESPPGRSTLPLRRGTELGLCVHPGLWCLGHVKVHGQGESTHIACPAQAPAERGTQCGQCFARDDSRLMHDFHRGGNVPAGLREYLMQPHWLYIATFAGGATKVGTASGARKWNRLAEQGAVHASYVALADDGRVVRMLEDLVTSELGIVQQVRRAAKAAALLEPRPAVELSAINKCEAARVRELLDTVSLSGFTIVEEQWERPAFADALCSDASYSDALPLQGDALPLHGVGRRHRYPREFDDGGHALVIESLSGAVALVTLPDGNGGTVEGQFVANLGQLKGRRIDFGPYTTNLPALQDSLF